MFGGRQPHLGWLGAALKGFVSGLGRVRVACAHLRVNRQDDAVFRPAWVGGLSVEARLPVVGAVSARTLVSGLRAGVLGSWFGLEVG